MMQHNSTTGITFQRRYHGLFVVLLLLFALLNSRLSFAVPGDILFQDNFNTTLINWTVTSAGGDARISNETSNSGNSLRMGWNTVTVTSNTFNASVPAATISVWIRRGGAAFSERPDLGEDLVFEYLNSTGTWVILETFGGGGLDGEIYTRSYSLPANALHANLRVRFRLLTASGNNLDYWHIDDLIVKELAPNSALIWYRLDETAWVGSGSVIDSSGNANPGNPVSVSPASPASSPAIVGDPGTCGYVSIPNNTDATINAIDTNYVPGNTGTISFWFNNNLSWNAGGDRLLFDASNDLGGPAADKNFFLIRRNNNNGALRFVIEDSNDLDTEVNVINLTFAANTWVHIAVTWNLTINRLEIYVNGTLRATGTTVTNGIMGNVSDVYFGDNRRTGAGDSGWTDDSANGLLDEFRAYNTVASATQILTDMNATHPCVQADHFAISHDTSAVNCQAEAVTINTHFAAHTVSTGFTGTLNLSTSTVHGDWTVITGLGTLVNGAADDGAATYTMVAGDLGSVTLGLKNPHVETLNINVSSGLVTERSGTALASEDQNLVFAASGFQFLANSVSGTIGLQIGGKASNIAPGAQALELQAIRTSPVTGACEAALLGVNQIQLAFECRNPTTCTANQVNINGGTATNIAGNPFGAISTYTPVNLDFGDATDTTASFVLDYPDVGELQLHARYNIPLNDGSNTPSGVFMMGSSNAFVSRPFGFYVTATGNPGATTAAGSAYVRAGTNFTAASTAVLYQAADDSLDNNGIADGHNDTNPANNANLADNLPTLNYGRETPVENINLGALLDQPAAGLNPGLTGTTSITSFTNGSGNTTAARYDEVGIIEISANVGDGDYLSIGAAATTNMMGKSGYVGRFIPNHFAIANAVMNNRSDIPACADPFTYMNENFRADFNLRAFNARTPAAITQNYVGAFAKLNTTNLLQMNYGATDTSSDLTARLNVVSAGVFANGTAPVQATTSLSRTLAVDGPYNTLNIGIAPADSDGVTLQTPDLSLNGGPNTHLNVGQTSVRYGRLILANNFGSELLPLSMQLSSQYYANATSQFVTNTNDNCTTISTANVLLFNGLAPKQGRALGNTTININGGNTTTLGAIPLFVNGLTTMNFTAPNARGSVDVEVQTPVYLLSNLDGVDQGIQGPPLQHCTPGMAVTEPAYIPACVADGVTVDDVPIARGTFGIFRGSDRVIYIREVY